MKIHKYHTINNNISHYSSSNSQYCYSSCTNKNQIKLLLLYLSILLFFMQSEGAQNEVFDEHKPNYNNKIMILSMAFFLIILVLLYIITGWTFIYIQQIFGTPFFLATTCNEFGLNRAIISTFPSLLYSDAKESKTVKMALDECAICMDEFEDNETLRLLPKCQHIFHQMCIDVWLVDKSTCPICRDTLDPNHDPEGSTVFG